MITLRKMTEDEFRAFRKTSTVDYAVVITVLFNRILICHEAGTEAAR